MHWTDSRRLTGPNLHLQGPGVAVEVQFAPGDNAQQFLDTWTDLMSDVLGRFDLLREKIFCRVWREGASVGFSAPIDRLYAATEMNEWCVEAAIQVCAGGELPSFDTRAQEIQQALAEEVNPGLLSLQRVALERDVPFLWDDDAVSLGHGKHSQTYTQGDLPSVETVDFSPFRGIEVAAVTGTNGKTTTSRMLSRILMLAGRTVGSTSSDGIYVDGEVVDCGDWTGPGAARRVLRRPDVDCVVLEMARGGLLRRGMGVDACDVAVITNIAEDHLGEYGIHQVSEMAEVKSIITRAVARGGARVLNADDPLAAKLFRAGSAPVIWFGLDAQNPVVQQHCARGGESWVVSEGMLVRQRGSETLPILAVTDLPASYGGTALHNVANALAASAAASALGVDVGHILAALRSFGRRLEDNPGRCQRYDVQGFHLIMDFAHNPAGVAAILAMARGLMRLEGFSRLCVSVGQAGDRTDASIVGLVEQVFQAQPELIILRKIVGYERGRTEGEVPALMREHLQTRQYPMDQVVVQADEVGSLDSAQRWSRERDLVVHLIHIQREPVQAWLAANRAQPYLSDSGAE